jgi:DNA polymerase eta
VFQLELCLIIPTGSILHLPKNILRNAAIPGYWRPMPFQSVCIKLLRKPPTYLEYLCQIRNLGGKLGKTLSTKFEVKTVGELEHISLGKVILVLASSTL